MELAPIVLFVYNRPDHTIKTIESLKSNHLSNQSKLYIYSDGPKNDYDKFLVNKTRNYIKDLSGFKYVEIIHNETNLGLANSIIKGVSSVIEAHGKVIVLEDDILTSKNFLKFMNLALDYYQDIDNVWSISGWNYPIDPSGLDDVFLWRVMNCWGWATWIDKWQYFSKDLSDIELAPEKLKSFNLDGYENFYKQLVDNKKGVIDTWAIFWYYTIFRNHGLCCNPTISLVKNIGLDGSGQHCSDMDKYENNRISVKEEFKFSDKIIENKLALKRIKSFYKPNIFNKILLKINNILN